MFHRIDYIVSCLLRFAYSPCFIVSCGLGDIVLGDCLVSCFSCVNICLIIMRFLVVSLKLVCVILCVYVCFCGGAFSND